MIRLLNAPALVNKGFVGSGLVEMYHSAAQIQVGGSGYSEAAS